MKTNKFSLFNIVVIFMFVLLLNASVIYSMENENEKTDGLFSKRALDTKNVEDQEEFLDNGKSPKKSKRKVSSSTEAFTESNPKQLDGQEFLWPYVVVNNEEWKNAALRAASSWNMEIEEYVTCAQQFLAQNKHKYGRGKNLLDLILFDKPVNDGIDSPEFAFK